MVSKTGTVLQRCEFHQRKKWRETARERGGYKPRTSKLKDVKAETPSPAPPRQQGGEKKAVNGHPWRQYPQAKPGATKMAKACPVCGRTPAMAGLWARMGVICMGCRVTPAGVIA